MASAAQQVISQDGNCGASVSQTCLGSRFGDCCSGKGFCGSDAVYCGADCQSGFGTCTNGADSARISVNGNCGASDPENQICKGSTFGDSCSGKGFCGSGPDYAGEGCQPDFGVCDGAATSAPSPTTAVPGSSPTSEPSPPPPASTTATEPPAAVTTTASSRNPTDTAITPDSTTSPTSYSPSSSGTAISDSSSSSTSLTGTQQPTSLSPGAKAGIAIAAVAVGAILFFAIFFFLRRRRRQQTQDQAPPSSSLEKPQRLNSSTTSPSPTNKPSLFNFPRSRTQTTTTSSSTVPPYGANSSVYEAYRSPAPTNGDNDAKFAAVELPLESDRRAEMRSGPATPGFFMDMPPVEKEAGNLHAVVSELPSERWSGVERRS